MVEEIYEKIARDDVEFKQSATIEGKNFFLNASNGVLTKLSEQLVSPKVILPWLLSTLGSPLVFTSLLVPAKDIGSLLPQFLISSKIKGFKKQKMFWSAAGTLQGIIWICLGLFLPIITETIAGIIIIISLLLFSMASGIGSIAFKEVLAKTISKGNRGKLLATRATGGGIFTLGVGLYLYLFVGQTSIDFFQWLLIIGGVLWIIAAIIFSLTAEPTNEKQPQSKILAEIKHGWKLFKEDRDFQLFLIARSLLMIIPVAQPFIIIFGKEYLDLQLDQLGLLIIVSGVSAAVSSPFWGVFSDKNTKKVMLFVAISAAILLFILAFYQYLPSVFSTYPAFLIMLFIINVIYAGARMSRKTYLVDFAPEKDRSTYVSMANSLMGIASIVAGTVGIIAQYFSLNILFGVLALGLIGSTYFIQKLKRTK